jgi:hypothetical protein
MPTESDTEQIAREEREFDAREAAEALVWMDTGNPAEAAQLDWKDN